MDSESFGLDNRSNRSGPFRHFGFFEDPIQVHRSAASDCSESLSEVVDRGMREIQDYPVHRTDVCQDGPGISLSDCHMFRSVRGDVRTEVFDRDRIGVGGVDFFGPTAIGDEDRVKHATRAGSAAGLSIDAARAR